MEGTLFFHHVQGGEELSLPVEWMTAERQGNKPLYSVICQDWASPGVCSAVNPKIPSELVAFLFRGANKMFWKLF